MLFKLFGGFRKFDKTCRMVLVGAIVLLICSVPVYAGAPSGPVTSLITVSGEENWQSDVTISTGGRIEISGDLTIENAAVRVNNGGSGAQPVITVQSGGSLTLKNSTLDLSGLGNLQAVKVLENGKLLLDGAKISGADCEYGGPLFDINGGRLELKNGSGIDQNSNKAESGSILRVLNGAFIMEDSSFSQNSAGYCEPNESGQGFKVLKNADSILSVESSEILIRGSVLEKNYVIGKKFFYVKASENFRIENSSFLKNDENGLEGGMGSGANNILSVFDTKVYVSSGNIFSGNGKTVLSLTRCVLDVEDDVSFTDNGPNQYFTISAGVISAHQTDVTIGKVMFRNNTGQAGAIYMEDGTLTINGASFIENKGEFFSGAIMVDTIVPIPESGYIHPYPRGARLVINDAVFIGNTNRSHRGTAIQLGGGNSLTRLLAACHLPTPNWFGREDSSYCEYFPPITLPEIRNLVQADIRKAEFRDNYLYETITSDGGTIHVGEYAHLKMRDVAIVENTADGYGAGIAAGPDAETLLYPRNGAAVFSNRSVEVNNDNQDLFIADNSGTFLVSEKMFNGGFHHWTSTTDIETAHCLVTLSPWNAMMFELTGTAMGAHPTNTDISGALVLIQNNRQEMEENSGTSADDWFPNSGAGIYNDGLLEIGDPETSVKITKKWDDEGAEGKRPDPAVFLNGLRFSADDEAYDLGTASLVSGSGEENGNGLLYQMSGDRFVYIQVETGEDNWTILVEGLPKLNTEGQEIRWTLDEDLKRYSGEISGDMTEGFVITNTYINEPEPQRPDFYLLEDCLEVLPQTGFPSGTSAEQ